MRRLSLSAVLSAIICLVFSVLAPAARATESGARDVTNLRIGVRWGQALSTGNRWPGDVPTPRSKKRGGDYWSTLYSFEAAERSVQLVWLEADLECGRVKGMVKMITDERGVRFEPPVLETASGSFEFRVYTGAINRNAHTIEVLPRLRWDCGASADSSLRAPQAFALDIKVQVVDGPGVAIRDNHVFLRPISKETNGGSGNGGGTEPRPEDLATSLPPGSKKDGYFAARVFFGTDRAPEEGDELKFSGLCNVSEELTYGVVEVSIPDSHKMGEIEAPSWWKRWDRKNPSKYVRVLSTTAFENRDSLAAEVRTLLSEAGREDVLVFVHGYNVNFKDAAKRTAQLAYDLKFLGAPVLYSWPSRGETSHYMTDEESVDWTVPHFQEFLRFVMTEFHAKDVHVVAHSMGNRALVQALSDFDVAALPAGSARLRQVILAAPDVSVALFKQLAAKFEGKADRITLYTSINDKAIKASREVHDTPRAGGEIVVLDGVDTIDASSVKTDFLAHSYFGDSIIQDLYAIIRNQLPPSQRLGLQSQSTDGGLYWKIVGGY